jgi:copper chaperone CopZ
MKSKILVLVMTLAMVFSFGNTFANKKNDVTVIFKAELHCKSCKAKIEKNLPFEKGVKDLKVDMVAKTIMIVYNSKKNTELALIAAIEKCGVRVLGKQKACSNHKCEHAKEHKHKDAACKDKKHEECKGDCGSCTSSSCGSVKEAKHEKCGSSCKK